MTWRGKAPVCWSALAASLRLSLQVSLTWWQSIAIKRPSWPNVPTVSKNRCRSSPRSLKENASTPLKNRWLIGTKDLTDTEDDADGPSRSITGARFRWCLWSCRCRINHRSLWNCNLWNNFWNRRCWSNLWNRKPLEQAFGTAGVGATFGTADVGATFGTAGLIATLGAADGFGTLLVALDDDDGRTPREPLAGGG